MGNGDGSDEGLGALAELPNLAVLDVTNARVSREGREQLAGRFGEKFRLSWSEPNRDAATAVQKATKLVERDKVDFLIGNINSALAPAMSCRLS